MAFEPHFKVNKMAKDLGMKSKDLTDLLQGSGVSVKTQSNLEIEEFELLFDTLTKANQIRNIEDYLDGLTVIPKAAPSVDSQPAKAQEKETPAATTTPAKETSESKPVTAAKEEGTSAKKAAPAKETAPAKEKKPSEEAPARKNEEKIAPSENANATKGNAPAKESTPVKAEAPAKETAPAKEAAPVKEATPVKEASGVKSNVPSKENAPTKENTQAKQGTKKPETTPPHHTDAPAQNAHPTAQPQKAAQPFGNANGNRPAPANPQTPSGQQTRRPEANGNGAQGRTDRPANNGFTPRQNGAPAPSGNGSAGYNRTQGGNAPYGQGRPANTGRDGMPYGQQPRQQNGFGGGMGGNGGNRQQQQGNRSQNGGNRGANGGGFGGGFDKDREYQQVGGLKETFHPQATIRVTKNDGSPTQRSTRIVDTRGSTAYDPSKYDEKLDTFVSDRVQSQSGGKIKQRQTPNAAHGAGNMKMPMGAKTPYGKKKVNEPVHILPQSVTLPDEIIVSDLASALKVKTADIVKFLMVDMKMMVTANQVIDYDTASLVADSFGIAVSKQVVVSIEDKLFDEEEDSEKNLATRAPVVCVMGHVDHGKTSLLDAIRHTHVTQGEAGGITQHIGAYRVKIKGQDITFLDTPGHEAFTTMRARGAQATDIAILVVAADDGIMPQTVEAIHHAKAAGVDIIVAINKMDKPGANPEGIKQELTKYELVPEEWGGDVMCVPVSALTGMGIDDLLESVLLVAEVKELKANPHRRAKGIVIEAKLDKGRGPIATVLVQNGTLRDGDIVIAGTAVGRVRAMTDYHGKSVKEAGPSVPVEITGLAEVPTAGDEFQVVADERLARELADNRKSAAKEEGFRANARANLNDLFNQISEGIKNLNIIVKADVVGSAEAVKQSLLKISNEEVKVCVIHSAAGGINEGDVMLAAASNAIIVGFNVRPDKAAMDSAERQGVEIRTYRIIYDCIEEITAAMKGMLAPKYQEVLLGHAEVRQTIHVPSVGTIAGSYITDGKVTRASKIRVLRDSVVIFEDSISSLKRFKDDAKEVAQGFECGIGLERFNDIKVGDVLEAYIMEELK